MRTSRTTLTLRTTDTRVMATIEMTSANAGIAEAMNRLDACRSTANMIGSHQRERLVIKNEFGKKDNLFMIAGIGDRPNRTDAHKFVTLSS